MESEEGMGREQRRRRRGRAAQEGKKQDDHLMDWPVGIVELRPLEESADGKQACQKADAVAARAPANAIEDDSMFVDGSYTGYFRSTAENNCTLNPFNCTGHIANYPCSWVSFVTQQTFQLDIALESNGKQPDGGYTSSQLKQIWYAANATKSDVVMMWWSPEALYETYRKYFYCAMSEQRVHSFHLIECSWNGC